MNLFNNKITNVLLLAALVSGVLISCKKEDKLGEFKPERMFTPVNVRATSGETSVRLEWNPSLFSGGGTQYTVEIIKDSTIQSAAVHTATTNTPSIVITDDVLEVKQKYFARIRANANESSAPSNWVISSGFSISGEQIFFSINPADIKDKSVLLKWRETTGLTKIVLKTAAGATTEVNLTAADIDARQRLITNLTASTTYTAEIFAGTKSKGTVTFQTKAPSVFTVELTPADDLIEAINNAANNDVIGLTPGTYDYSTANLNIVGKHITLQSTSGNWNNTKVLFKEITLKGTGAGVKVSGLEFDGTVGNAGYFINLTGVNGDAETATFTSILVENSLIHGTANSLLRGNRGANNAYKIDFIKFDNNIIHSNGNGGFDYILLDKMEFNRLELVRTTFYNSGRRLISWATNITAPKPTILIDRVTINGLGYGGRDNVLLDANANPVDFTLRNSIIANIPKAGQTTGTNAFRASNASSTIIITNNNMFNLTNGASTPAPIVFAVAPQNNRTIDLGWTPTTNVFTLPPGSELRTASTTGDPIGDPRWVQ